MTRGAVLILITLLLAGLAAGLPLHARADELPKIPVKVNADKLDYDRTNDVYVAVGHVRVEQEGMKLEADKIVLNNKTGEAVAEGKVYLQEKGDIIRADKLLININTRSGIIYNGDLFMKKDNLHVKGEKIERKSETEYHVEKGTFTTCDENEWNLKADVIDLDMDRYATGRGVSFNMGGVPVLYTPYLLFPVRRQTGLLIPEAGYSSSEGFLMKNSFFWAISDSQDMTFYSDYRAEHGHGTGVEYRYSNSRDSSGKVFYNYFDSFSRFRDPLNTAGNPDTPGTPDNRWQFLFQHHEEIAEDLSIRADINLVSDFAYFTDIEKKSFELTSLPYLDSDLFYIERWDTSSLNLLGQYAIDLTQKSNENTIQKLPELRYNIFEEKIAGPVHLNFDGSAANFSIQAGENVMRADFNPRLSAAFGSGLTFTPRAGVRATYYDRSLTSSEPTERKFYYAGADLNARFSRVYGTDGDLGIGRVRHSVEPGISYNYIPDFDQPSIPQLDAVDTVTAQNRVSGSLTNRLTAHYKDAAGSRSFDLMVFRLSESYDLNKARNADTTIVSGGTATVPATPRSELRGELSIKTPKLLTLSAIASYDTYTHEVISTSEGVTITTDPVKFNVTYQYLREPKTRYLIGGTDIKLGKWNVLWQIWRDLELETNTQQEYQVHYASQCWGLGIGYVAKPGEKQYLLTLELKGLGTRKF
jgi:LPS-assembly protein